MKDPVFEKLVETNQRRPLTSAELAGLDQCLVRNPELRQEWLLEQNLNRALRSLPDVEVPPQFVSSVLRRVETFDQQQAAGSVRLSWFRYFVGQWLKPVAVSSLALGVLLLLIQNHQERSLREIGHQAALFTRYTAMVNQDGSASRQPPFQWLQDYDAITLLRQPGEVRADTELLASLP